MNGENFTQEYKYPIKIYKIGTHLQFSNGVEVRKVIASVVAAGIILALFIIAGVKTDGKTMSFFKQNWLVILTLIPAAITFIIFNLKYDNKGIIAFFRDRIRFLFTKHKEYEHFIEVPTNQIQEEMSFEPFIVKEGEHE